MAWAKGRDEDAPLAFEMDAVLHAERIDRGRKRIHAIPGHLNELPDGAVIIEWAYKGEDYLVKEVLKEAGYPGKADPEQINYLMVFVLLWVLVLYVTMVYGPIAAWLIELFPARIRYTSMSLPYHIGNGWFGGFLPTVAFALVALSGNIYYGLRYPIIVALMTLVVGILFLPETKDRTDP